MLEENELLKALEEVKKLQASLIEILEEARQLPSKSFETEEDEPERNYSKEDVEQLKKLNESFLQQHIFVKGDVVKWKKGLRNKKFPLENQPAIVMDTFNPPLPSSDEQSGSTYFREPLDILIGICDIEDGEFITYYHDSRRFEPYETE